MKRLLVAVVVVVALAAGGCGGGDDAEPVAAEPEPVAAERGFIVELRELNDSGLSGTANLAPAGTTTEVVVSLSEASQDEDLFAFATRESCETVAQGTTISLEEQQYMHIRPGLTQDSSRFFVPLEELQAGDFVLAIFPGGEGVRGPSEVAAACGEITR